MIMSRAANLPFEHLSAVAAGKAEIQALVKRARGEGRTYLLFLDEIHRFNKAQQDALLPYVEDGTLILVGATTENPSFSLNNALLSRCRVLVLKPLDAQSVQKILARARDLLRRESAGFDVSDDALAWLSEIADGDARYVLNALESIYLRNPDLRWDADAVKTHWSRRQGNYDRGGDYHYDLISALHKCVRDSDADAASYWLARMLHAGEEPLYIARRLIRMATEDIGLADPRALHVALDAHRMYEILGSPEGEEGLFEAVIYLALAPKSNAVYVAEKRARRLAKDTQNADVPMHLRNAPTRLMKELGHGASYQYAHNDEDGVVIQRHFPEGMQSGVLYEPAGRGFERQLAERMSWLAEKRKKKGAQ
jgi:putative ATPase